MVAVLTEKRSTSTQQLSEMLMAFLSRDDAFEFGCGDLWTACTKAIDVVSKIAVHLSLSKGLQIQVFMRLWFCTGVLCCCEAAGIGALCREESAGCYARIDVVRGREDE